MKPFTLRRQRGFSLIELMVVLLLLSVLMGAVFRQISQVQARAGTEQSRLDLFQESREFVDQMARDLRGAGYPNIRNYATVLTNNDPNIAVGLVKADVNELRFEGDVDGDGQVDSLVYGYASTGNNCPCLQRSQVAKINADPLTGQGTSYALEVQNVQNGTSSDPIFRAFDAAGNEVTLPVNINSNASAIAKIKTIQISLTVQARNPDVETHQRPRTTVRTTIRLPNCSSAAVGQAMSCRPS